MEYLVEGKPHATLSLPVKDQKHFCRRNLEFTTKLRTKEEWNANREEMMAQEYLVNTGFFRYSHKTQAYHLDAPIILDLPLEPPVLF